MTLETIMTRKVVSVAPDATIADVIGKLYAYKISCVVVCEGSLPVGMISERDMVSVLAKRVCPPMLQGSIRGIPHSRAA